MTVIDIPDRVIARVLSHLDQDPGGSCLVSRYSVASHGYAQVGWYQHGQQVDWIHNGGINPDYQPPGI